MYECTFHSCIWESYSLSITENSEYLAKAFARYFLRSFSRTQVIIHLKCLNVNIFISTRIGVHADCKKKILTVSLLRSFFKMPICEDTVLPANRWKALLHANVWKSYYLTIDKIRFTCKCLKMYFSCQRVKIVDTY